MGPASIAAVVLAGGRSTRMGGRNKALAELDGRPLIRHVIDRLRPQVDALAISVETTTQEFDALGLPQLADPAPGHQGPLGGLLAALRHYAGTHDLVLLAPCDAPLLPPDLAARLHATASEASAPAAVVRWAGELQPTFSIWNRMLLDSAEDAVGAGGLSGFKQFMRRVPVAICDWPGGCGAGDLPPFFNINDDAALREAEGWLQAEEGENQTCSA